MNEQDFVAAGFHRLDPKLMTKRPPMIQWGLLYQAKTDQEKIRYLEKLASSMNHAASLIQDERNQLGALCALKEQQIVTLNHTVTANNAMLQQEVTRMNEDRQGYHAAITRLNTELRALRASHSGD